ncbi:GNAT family protein [Micromonospora polyrhachis]|uniref:RimJ/RimL family protein N-acetyltransferase n=1 Tax=Micromonospora polyrhachis TaxID=1282883 RepID=A0A7W7SWJ0_9ACTN|nr:GNAT family protein [Micromonospora polyrhachis]MBB4960975.1 RimJ/RimL family protein N-acetyltransferase [Micromonospora polyrhachis]
MFAIPLGDDAVLRPLEPWQAEEFAADLDRAREHIAPWVGPSFVATGVAGAREVLQRYADKQAKDDARIYGIWRDGVLVGGTLFVSVNAAAGVCEVGCWLEPAAEGRGLITRAVSHMIDWAVEVRGITRVEWVTKSANTRSRNVAKRLGMSLDGVLRQSVPADANGVRADQEVWSVLADEWRSR